MANFRMLALMVSTLVFCARANAQSFGLFVTNAPNPAVVSNSLIYTISVTNETGGLLQNVFVTNTFSSSFQFVSASTNSQNFTNSYSVSSSNVVFAFGSLSDGYFLQMTQKVRPLITGLLTNFVTVGGVTVPVAAFTNVVQVISTNATADLGVTMSGFPSDIYVNDIVTYQVSVTNGGPDSAGNVILSNGVPDGVELLGFSPTNQFSTATNFIVLNLGALTNGASKNIFFTVQPTNSGVVTFSAFV